MISEVVFLLLFSVEFVNVHPVALMAGSAAGIGLPVLIMPLCYAFVNGNTAIATGRYHLPMAVAGLLSALSYVMLLGIDAGNAVGQGFALAGLLFLHSLSTQIYLYAYYSIGQRFDQSGNATALRGIFTLLTAITAAVLVTFMYDGSLYSVAAITAVAAVISVAGIVAVYFGTVRAMPGFIRLEPKHKRSVKENYSRFVSPLRTRPVLMFSIAAFLTCAAVGFAASALPSAVYFYAFGLVKGFKPAVLVAGALIVPMGVFIYKACRHRPKACANAAVTLSAVQTALAAAVSVVFFVPAHEAIKALALYLFAALAGVAMGASVASGWHSNEYGERLSGCTSGRYYCLHNCVSALGFALGLSLTPAADIISSGAGEAAGATVSCCVYAAILLIGAVVSRIGYSGKSVGRSIPPEPGADVVNEER